MNYTACLYDVYYSIGDYLSLDPIANDDHATSVPVLLYVYAVTLLPPVIAFALAYEVSQIAFSHGGLTLCTALVDPESSKPVLNYLLSFIDIGCAFQLIQPRRRTNEYIYQLTDEGSKITPGCRVCTLLYVSALMDSDCVDMYSRTDAISYVTFLMGEYWGY